MQYAGPIFKSSVSTGNIQGEVRMSGRAGEKSRHPEMLTGCSTVNLNAPDVMKYASLIRDLQELAGSRNTLRNRISLAAVMSIAISNDMENIRRAVR